MLRECKHINGEIDRVIFFNITDESDTTLVET